MVVFSSLRASRRVVCERHSLMSAHDMR